MAPDPLAGHPAVSVIVPICDGGTALAEQLEAIGRQAGPGVELVLVDDGSRDGSLQLAERFAAAAWPPAAPSCCSCSTRTT
jgi:glycosyltransferase involved in cell wall biosynthesis